MGVVECKKCRALLEDGEVACPQCGSSDAGKPGEDDLRMLSIRKELNTFVMTDSFSGEDRDNGIAIDENNKRIALIFNRSSAYLSRKKVIQAEEVLEALVDVVRGDTTTKTNGGNQLGRVIVGGLVLGGVGAVIGGLTASKTTTQIISRIDLVVRTSASGGLSHRVNLLTGDYLDGSQQVRKAIEAGNLWALKINAMRDKSNSIKNGTTSIADELGKLVWLREHGEITQLEFEQLKRKLLT